VKCEGKRPLGRPRPRWKDNIKDDLKNLSGRAWIGFILQRIGTSGEFCGHVIKLGVFVKCEGFCDWPRNC
jgi:hypothetical protein